MGVVPPTDLSPAHRMISRRALLAALGVALVAPPGLHARRILPVCPASSWSVCRSLVTT